MAATNPMNIAEYIRDYKSDQRGQYAIITAILSMPLLLAASATMDFSSAMSEHKAVKNALDNAVLAAVSNDSVSLAQKEQIAKRHFEQNYNGRIDFTTSSKADDYTVSMSAKGVLPFSISDALGLDGIKVDAYSKAALSMENVVCVLALDKSGADAITFTSDLKFAAPSCTVQSNSTSATSINSNGTYAPLAKSFCAAGGISGAFNPHAKGECRPIDDPYATVPAARIGSCMPDSVYATVGSQLNEQAIWINIIRAVIAWIRAKRDGEAAKWAYEIIPDSGNTTGSNTVFYPGTYCNGLTVDGRDVTFMPGDYVIKDGPLTFKNAAQAAADNVTFGFTGLGSTLRIEEGSNVLVKAATSGDRKGLAFMEMPGSGGRRMGTPGFLASMITSGGSLQVIGALYFPRQKLIVSGSGTKLGAQSPSTSFIAYNLIFEGERGSEVVVNVDHNAAGLPPVLPRASEGAILVE